MKRERYDDFLHIAVDGDPPRCRVIWETILARHNAETPEGGCALDRDLIAFLDTIDANDLRAHYQSYFRRMVAALRGQW